jgi:Fe2+ or Zn2+ uptake regulation protein
VTNAPRSDRLAFRDIGDVAAALRERGGRLTAARRRVLEALFAADGPVGAEAIASGLGGRMPGSDLASVYRNLDTLEQIGMVRHFHLAHGRGLYALTGRDHAGYATCERCGAHHALDPEAVARVAAALREACGYEAHLSHFPIVGTCPECDDAHS